jgi:outer membrane protein OmpA-like peptidoglycan-associated protein
LTGRGIPADRIVTVGLGEEYPIASNDTQAGMQQNRRVEIVLSDTDGRFPAAALERTARLGN